MSLRRPRNLHEFAPADIVADELEEIVKRLREHSRRGDLAHFKLDLRVWNDDWSEPRPGKAARGRGGR